VCFTAAGGSLRTVIYSNKGKQTYQLANKAVVSQTYKPRMRSSISFASLITDNTKQGQTYKP
jgi:hypothetical protein